MNNCLELSSLELDLVILTSIQAFTRSDCIGGKRSPRCTFYFQSKPICKEMFLHFYGISYLRFRRLKEHYEQHGISPRQHGNTKRLPQNTLPQSTIEDVHSFLANYEVVYNNGDYLSVNIRTINVNFLEHAIT